MLEIATHRQPMLESIANLFEALHGDDIAYCNLKGNDQHLRSAVTGQSDIDILFDKSQKAKLEMTLQKLGYKEFIAIREKRFKDVCDYFVLDEVSGKIIHLHAYFGFTFGEPFLKGYQPDVARHILATRVYNNDYGLYCIQPAIELTLLYLTETLKLRHRDALSRFLQKDLSPGQKSVYQYNWLKMRTTTDEIEQALHAMFPGHSALGKLAGSPLHGRQLRLLAPLVKRSLSKYRLYSPLRGLLTRWWREISVKIRSKLAGVLRLPIPNRRSNPRGGKIVALLENDAGVRTILFHALKDTFARKIDVYQIAFNNDLVFEGQKGHQLGRCLRGISRACFNWLRSKQIDMAKKNGALVIYNFHANGIVAAATLPAEGPKRGSLITRLLVSLQVSIESNAKRLCAPDIVFQFTPRGVPCQLSDGKPLRTEDGYSVLTVDPDHTVTEKLDILKREIWNHL